MKHVVIEAVEGTSGCEGCVFRLYSERCTIEDATIKALGLPKCGQSNIIFKVREDK